MLAGNCNTYATSGSVAVQCTNTATGSTVTLSPPTLTTVGSGTITHRYYVGCGPPTGGNKCSLLNNFGGGGSLTASTTKSLTCACGLVNWIVASTTTAPAPAPAPPFTVDQVNGACPV